MNDREFNNLLIMDGSDLFRKLGLGARFNFKKFQEDAEKLRIIKTRPTHHESGSGKDENSQTQTNMHEPHKGGQVVKRKRLNTLGVGHNKNTRSDPPHKRIKEKESHAADSESEDSGNEQVEQCDQTDSPSETESSEISQLEGGEAVKELQLLGSIRSRGGDEFTQRTQKRNRKKEKRKKTAEKKAELKQEQINHFRKKNRIHVYGSDVPDPAEAFTQLQDTYGLHPRIVSNLHAVGFSSPTPIQMQAIPVMLMGRELLACAPTGSGKTAAFVLPILHNLREPRNLGFRALVLAPTRELARQTYLEFQRLAEGRGFRIHVIEKASTAEKKFGPHSGQKFDILVTTPNRLVYLLKQDPPAIKLENVEWLVVDESDKLFEEGKTGFRDQLAVIYQACTSSKVRRAMFSATFAYELEEWCRLNLDNVVQVYIGARNVAADSVQQELVFVGSESGKLLAVRDVIRKGLHPPVLIFVQSKERAKDLFHELIYDGINVDVIHADRTQLQRDNVIKSFRSGKIWVLICTDLMGRGIDFKGVNLVINYDFPNSAVSYIHRIGRTGRAGKQGNAITLFTEDDAVNLRSIANVMRETGCHVPDYMLQMKRPSKKARRKLAKQVPQRETIRTVSKYDLEKSAKHKKFQEAQKSHTSGGGKRKKLATPGRDKLQKHKQQQKRQKKEPKFKKKKKKVSVTD